MVYSQGYSFKVVTHVAHPCVALFTQYEDQVLEEMFQEQVSQEPGVSWMD